MGQHERWVAVALVVAGLALSACTRTSNEPEQESVAEVHVVRGTNQSRVILTRDAADRLGIQTARVRESSGPRGRDGGIVIPYAAVLYDANGGTWTYTNPEPLVFVRQAIQIADIRGGLAFLTSGPTAGTQVVVVGASELLGTEYAVGGE